VVFTTEHHPRSEKDPDELVSRDPGPFHNLGKEGRAESLPLTPASNIPEFLLISKHVLVDGRNRHCIYDALCYWSCVCIR
jgi:hypothetical protein